MPKIKRADEKIVDYFLELKNWADQPKSFYIKNGIPKYNRFLKPARDLLELCDNNLDRAKLFLDKTKEWTAGFGGEDWGLETAIKKFLEIK